jgi:hypothetical protein
VTLDPDAQVRGAVAHLFRLFEQTGSAQAVVKQFAAEHLRFRGRHAPGGRTGARHSRSRCATTWCCSRCTTPDTRARTSMGGASS